MQKPILVKVADFSTFPPFNTQPIDGYKLDEKTLSGKPFPHCCPFHDSVYEITSKWYESFPNCCKGHKKIAKLNGFDRSLYKDIATKVVTQLSYTEYHIEQNNNLPDWYEDITAYILYNIQSFGAHGIGAHLYTENVKVFLEKESQDLDSLSREKLIKYIDTITKEDKESSNNLGNLLNTYNQWLDLFPFELSLFSHLKESYFRKLPILKSEPVHNKYLQAMVASIHTPESLMEWLIHTTNKMLTNINTLSLYKKGLLTEPEKVEMELVVNKRVLKLKNGYSNASPVMHVKVRNMLKEWLKDEKKFVQEIIRLEKSSKAKTELPENKFEKIFVNKVGYNLFLKWHSFYKGSTTKLADYSYLFNMMTIDNLVVCRNKDFIKFLGEDFEIIIEKIDSRYTGKDSKKHPLYQSTKKGIESQIN